MKRNQITVNELIEQLQKFKSQTEATIQYGLEIGMIQTTKSNRVYMIPMRTIYYQDKGALTSSLLFWRVLYIRGECEFCILYTLHKIQSKTLCNLTNNFFLKSA